MDYLPIFLDLRGRRCVVVGGGAVGLRKARTLLGAGAHVEVVAPRALPELERLEPRARLRHLARPFTPADLDGCVLAIAATADEMVNRAVAEAARARALPVNVVDTPAQCTFVMPSIVDRSPVIVAIATGGVSPVLARLVRARIETLLAPRLGRLARLAGTFREPVKSVHASASARRRFWERVLGGPVAELVYAGREEEARRSLAAALEDRTGRGAKELWVLAGGAGEADLQTLRALRVLQQADVVLFEDGVSEGVLELARRDADRIAVGPPRRAAPDLLDDILGDFDRVAWVCADCPQEALRNVLARAAARGVRVHRLPAGSGARPSR